MYIAILLVLPKSEKIMCYKFFSSHQYCDSYNRLFSITSCKVITFNLLCLIFGISSLPLSLIALSKVIFFYSYHYSDSCCSFSLFYAIAKRFLLLFAITVKNIKCTKPNQKLSKENMSNNFMGNINNYFAF